MRFACLTLALLMTLTAHANAGPLEEALTLDRQGFIGETVPHWEAFIATKPEKNLDIYSNIKMCLALQKMGRLMDAYNQALKLAGHYPDDFHAQFNLANMGGGIRRYAEAVTAFEKVIGMKPEEGLGKIGLGLSLFGDQKTEPALGVLRDARKLFKEQKNIPWYQNTRIMIGQMKSFAPYPPDFSDLWLTNNLKTIRDTYYRTLFLEYEKSLNL